MRSVPRRHNRPDAFLSTRGIAARETLFYLDKHGIDAESLLSKAEFSRSQLAQDAKGVSTATQHRFLELAATRKKTRFWGFMWRQRWI